jgi:hypothetical protein
VYYTKGKRKGVAMKDIFKSSLLYDFYGELLTEHQKEIYEENETTRILRIGSIFVDSLPVLQKSALPAGC